MFQKSSGQRILDMQIKADDGDRWYGETKKMAERINLTLNTKGVSKSGWKKKIKEKVEAYLKRETR